MTYQNTKANSINDICDLFSQFFENNYIASTYSLSEPECLLECISRFNTVNNIGCLEFSLDEIYNGLLLLDVNKGLGPDGVPPLLLKKCANAFAFPLKLLFNKSLQTGVFPSCWKMSYVTPIFKSGARSKIENYRGILILPTIAKFFESLVCKFLYSRLLNNLSVKQHGFLKGRSTTSNLLEFSNFLLSNIESGFQIDVLFTDFSKAFDRIQHNILIKKICGFGIHSSMLKWIWSYLTNRSQFVQINNCKSKLFSVHSGVPQFIFCYVYK